MPILQQNLSTSVPFGPFISSTDGATIGTALVAGSIQCLIWKNGAMTTFNLTTAMITTALTAGMGTHTYTTANVDTIGNLTFYFYTTNYLPVREDYYVESSNQHAFRNGTRDAASKTWEELRSTHETTGTFGDIATINAITSGVWNYTSRDLSTYAGLSSAVWQETTRMLTTAAVITSDIMNRVIDGSLTMVQAQRLMTGVLLGNSTGGGTTSISFQTFGTTGVRVSYTVTTAGNRAITTYSLTS